MRFQWDETKRAANMVKHGIDFADADKVFDAAHVILPGRTIDGEARLLAIGLLDAAMVAVVHTRRGEALRVISMRRARDNERREYRNVYG